MLLRENKGMIISQRAFYFIVNEETGGEDYYNKTELHTDWPGGASGVTIGIGYDLGYATQIEIQADWGILPGPMVEALKQCAGIHGTPAHSLTHEFYHEVTVPWGIALKVFADRDVPKWERAVQNALPNTDKLSGDSLGALVSVAFNRGASFNMQGPRFLEMRNIKQLMKSKDYRGIPHQIENMARLWPNSSDLRGRRKREAELFEGGL
jgi:hypothetical protein